MNSTLVKKEQQAFIRNGTGTATDTLKPFVLGNERPNPYSVTNMTAAWNALYPSNTVTELPATHLYVKFTPQNSSEIILIDSLLDTLGYVVAPYPLIREVIEEGDYYISPGKTEDDMPEIWSVVETDFVSPISGYQILESLMLAPDDSYLTAKSFIMSGAPMEDGPENPANPEPCNEGCQLYPYCLVCFDLGCSEDDFPFPELDYPDCLPGDPDFPHCLQKYCDPAPPPGPNLNQCGCPIPANDRQPAGCVQVQDGGLGYLGVRDVRVIVGNGWFSWRNTRTNDQGCWKTNQRIGSWNRCRVWVRFKSGTVKVHELSWRVWHLLLAVTDYAHVKKNPPFNRFLRQYDPGSLGSRKQRNWFAALNNNGVHEFHDYANDEGIGSPPPLVITIGTEGSGSAAPMFGYLIGSTLTNDFFTKVTGIVPRFLGPLGGLMPDIYSKTNGLEADEEKATIYHEVAHASHYSLVGSSYWSQIIAHEVANNGWGSPPFNGVFDAPGPVSITESWASHIGWDFASIHYGAAASIFNPRSATFPDDAWGGRQEFSRLAFGWIPVGIWGDLADIQNDEDPGSPLFGLDVINSITNAQLYPLLIYTDFASIRAALGLLAVPPNTPAEINTMMMTGYGLP